MLCKFCETFIKVSQDLVSHEKSRLARDLRDLSSLLSTLEPHSMDSLGHQHRTKKLSPKIALHFKVLCESKATLPYILSEHYLGTSTR